MRKSRRTRDGARPRLWFFGGKGGVGKTTCAAAAAVRRAREGRRVLVVSTDPAHSLGDALDTRLGADPKKVEGTLFAAQLDADRALDRWLGEREDAFRTVAERGTYLDREDVDKLLSLSLPGVDELVGLLELARLARERPWDDVVVDTAPTGHTLRLLEMPETLRRFASVLDDMHEKHRFLARSLGGVYRPDFADEVIADIERDASDLRAALTDPERTAFTWVTLPEELPVLESSRGIAAVEALGIAVPVVVANRVWPAPDRPCPLCTPRVRDEARWLRALAKEHPRRTLLVLPAAVAEPRGADALWRASQSVRSLASGVDPPPAPAPASPRPKTRSGSATALSRQRLVLFGGKGGVGKTTCAAAFALDAAQKADVLVLSTDPAHSLGDAFAVELGDEPVRVAPRLHARELDAKKAFDEERERYRSAIDDLFSSIFRGRMDAAYDRRVLEDLVEIAPPGIDEIFALVSIVDALVPTSGKPAYGRVVVDTAPTGHTLRLLALPEKALEWVHAIMSVLLKYRHVIGLGELASDLTSLARRLRALAALMHDPKETAFVAVTRPALLPALETERLAAELRRLAIPLGAVLVNAVTEPSCARCRAAAAHEAEHLRRIGRLGATVLRAPAVHPGPRGDAELSAFHALWTVS